MDSTARALLEQMLSALGLSRCLIGLVVRAAQLSKRAQPTDRDNRHGSRAVTRETTPGLGLDPRPPVPFMMAGLGFLVVATGAALPFL